MSPRNKTRFNPLYSSNEKFTRRLLVLLVFFATAATDDLIAQGTGATSPKLTFSGDVRLRFEEDWDSQNAAGVPRDDRTRGRIRARASAGYKFSDVWTAGARVRTGNTHSQQSPHLTFASNDGVRDDLEFVADRYFVQYKEDSITAWAGRNSFPIWQQNELFWDDDVTPTGIAGSYETGAGNGRLTTTLGVFALPDGGFGLNGNLLSGQVKYTFPTASGKLTFAGGLHQFNGEAGAEDLRNRNGARDYFIGVANAQWASSIREVPFTVGFDLFHNFENYDAIDAAPFPPADADETTGFVFSALYGQLSEPGNWQLGYFYAHIETFSVNASFAQDDWIRFGSATQTDSSDFSGHEFRFSYAISKTLNVVSRLYLVDAITTIQDGNRFRVDLNWKF